MSPVHWTMEMPWVLLGIRTAPKDDLGCSLELAYGAPVTVPGDFLLFTGSHDVPMPTSRNGVAPSSMPSNMKQSLYVFVRRDAYCTPLHRPHHFHLHL